MAMYDLNILLEEGKTPYYEQIYEYLKKEIAGGSIPPATRLPSTRRLAQNLSVSRSTTQAAYDQLVAEGYLIARQGSGYYAAELEWRKEVGETPGSPFAGMPGSQAAGMNPASAHYPASARSMAGTSGTGEKSFEDSSEEKEAMIDFSPRGVDSVHVPVQSWRSLTRKVLSETGGELFNAGSPQGEREFREAIAAYLYSARGVVCHPDQILVGAGSEYLLLLLARMLPVSSVAMEEYTYRQAGRVLEQSGIHPVPVESDEEGVCPESLAKSGASLLYAMPSHQFPTGCVMPIRRRMALLSWADKEENRYIIEDDYDSEFRYRGKPIPALQGIDTQQKVIYLGTFSRSIAPSIRISYLVLPEKVLVQYREKCEFYASTVSKIDQLVMARFLREGFFERHLNRMRGIYREKHDAMLEGLKGLTGHFTVSGADAGTHLLLSSREKTEEEIVKAAAENGVLVYPMSRYQISGQKKESHTVVCGYANLSLEEIREGTRRLCEALK